MKVLIIPEDQELDRYITKPVVEALFDELGLRARVQVLPEPRLRGAADALDAAMIDSIIADNPMEDLFLLMVDNDCNRQGNTSKAKARQEQHPHKLITCVAVQEIEVWMLALYRGGLDAAFQDVRQECDPKERWAEPLLESLGSQGPGRGRKKAMQAIKGRWRSLRDSCLELKDLEAAVKDWHSQLHQPG